MYALALDASGWKISQAFAAFKLLELRGNKLSFHGVTPFYLTRIFDENGCPLLLVSDSIKSSSGAECNETLTAVIMIINSTDRGST